jgi:hypothetical protein
VFVNVCGCVSGGALCICGWCVLASAFEQRVRAYVHEPVFVRVAILFPVSLVTDRSVSDALSVTRDSGNSKQRLPLWAEWAYSCIVWTRVRPSDKPHQRHGAVRHGDGRHGQSAYLHT